MRERGERTVLPAVVRVSKYLHWIRDVAHLTSDHTQTTEESEEQERR